MELPINDIFEKIPYEEPEPELPINDIFENEIPYDEEYAMFEYKIFEYPFEFMTFCEFRHYLPQFYKYLSKHRYFSFNYNKYYRRYVTNIYDIYINHKSFDDFYTMIEEAFVDW